MNLRDIYILFWFYSILGWIMETTKVSLNKKKIINRGFFLGPYCPIYGTGGILLLTLKDYQSEPLVVFILSIVICSLVEYLTSYFMELIYRVRWWDYSNRMLNINGRICFFNSICFGLMGMVLVCFLNPYFLNLINKMNSNVRLIIVVILFIGTTIDMIITFNAMFDIRKTVLNIKDKTFTNLFKPNTDNTEEVSKRVKSIIKDKTIIHRHITKAYSNFKIYKNYFLERKEEITKRKIKERLENRYVIASFISVFVGYLLGIVFHNIGFFVAICFVLGIVFVYLYSRGNDGK